MSTLCEVWVFNGVGGQFPAGVFSDLQKAEAWIAHSDARANAPKTNGVEKTDRVMPKCLKDKDPLPAVTL